MRVLMKRSLLGLMMAVTLVGGSSTLNVEAASVNETVSGDSVAEIVEDEDKDYKLKITVDLEKQGWYKDAAKVKVKVEKIYGDSKFKIEKVEAKIGSTGAYLDITDDMFFEINENCTTYVKVTDVYGNEFEKSRTFKCFDLVAPTLNAAVSEGLLNVMSYDTESGVKDIYINEYHFTPDDNGVLSVRLQKFDASYQNFYIYAIDEAGNKSVVNTVKNPYYKDPNAEEEESEDSANSADSLPDNAAAEVTSPSTGEVTSVTDEDGNDISAEVRKKQFYTIVTKDGQQYFLVIDMTPKSTDDDGVNVTPDNGMVYFLTSVSNQNLLNFVDGSEQTLPQNSLAVDNGIDDETVTPEMDETTEATTESAEPEQEEKESGNENMIIFIVLGVVLIGAVGFKLLGGNKGKADQNDDALYGEGKEEDEEEITSLEELNEEE